jgi:hypothetical protein
VNEESLLIGLMMFGPLVFALMTFISALLLFGTVNEGDKFRVLKLVVAGALMIVTLGIGACYGVLFFGRLAG